MASLDAATGTGFVTAGPVLPVPLRRWPVVPRPRLRPKLPRTPWLVTMTLCAVVLAVVLGLLLGRGVTAPPCGAALLRAPDGRCVQCMSGSDCASHVCGAAGTCVQCARTADCATVGADQVCARGACVPACVSSESCSAGSVCDGAACVQCVQDSDCEGVLPAPGTSSVPVTCDINSNRCVQCTAGSPGECPAGYECSQATSLCVLGCSGATECPDLQYCAPSGVCAYCSQATLPSDCPAAAPYCTPGGCVACTPAAGCSSVQAPYCADDGTCVSLTTAIAGAGVQVRIADGSSSLALSLAAGVPQLSFTSVGGTFTLVPDTPGASGAWALLAAAATTASPAVASVSQVLLSSPASLAAQAVTVLPPHNFNLFLSSAANGVMTTVADLAASGPVALSFGTPIGADPNALYQIGGGAALVSLVADVQYPLTLTAVPYTVTQ